MTPIKKTKVLIGDTKLDECMKSGPLKLICQCCRDVTGWKIRVG